MKKLYRSKDNKVVAGVLGGIGEYMDVDPTVLRIIFIVVLVLTAVIPMGIAYVIAILLMPARPHDTHRHNIIDGDV